MVCAGGEDVDDGAALELETVDNVVVAEESKEEEEPEAGRYLHEGQGLPTSRRP